MVVQVAGGILEPVLNIVRGLARVGQGDEMVT